MSFPNSHFSEYICNSPDGRAVLPCFGDLFLDEPVPTNGRIDIDETKPGFGLTLYVARRVPVECKGVIADMCVV